MIRVRTLGQCVIEIDGVKVGPDAEIVFAALLLLTLESRRPLARSEIIRLLWPDAEPARAAHCLRQTIYRIRSLGVLIKADRSTIAIASPDISRDVDEIESVVDTTAMARIADRLNGGYLPGYAPGFSTPFAAWVERQRDSATFHLRRVFISALATRRAAGDWSELERLATQCLAIDPLNEKATLLLAEAAALNGGKREAIQVLDRYLAELGPVSRELIRPAADLRRQITEPHHMFEVKPPRSIPLIGRRNELADLLAALERADSGEGNLLLIHGEAGIGKTTIVRDLACRARGRGAVVVDTACQPSYDRRPLSAFVDLVPALLSLPGAIGCAPQSHKYLRRFLEQHPTASPPSADAAEANLLFFNVRQAVLDLLDAIANEQPLLIVIEDVHRLDKVSWDLLSEVALWSQTRRLLVVMTSRTSDAPVTALGSDRCVVRCIRLLPLGPEARMQLVDAALGYGADRLSQQFRRWAEAMSAGNPYFLTELVTHGLRTGGKLEVPPTLKSLVSQTVRSLRPDSRRVLQACAIIGRNATLELIEQLLDQSRMQLIEAYDELEEKEILRFEDGRLKCPHDLTLDAALDSLSSASRAYLHRKAARILAANLKSCFQLSLAWDCAEHLQAAGEPSEAAAQLRECARQALELGRPNEANDILVAALKLSLSDQDKTEIEKERLHALGAADQWEGLIEVLSGLADRERRLNGNPHSSYEYQRYLAEWCAGRSADGILSALRECCRSPVSSSAHRIQCACLLFMIADNVFDDEVAHSVYSLLEADLAPGNIPERAQIHCRLIYDVSFGNLDHAEASARTLGSLVRDSQPSREKYVGLIHVAETLRYCGYADEATLSLEQIYHEASAHALQSAACYAGRMLCWHAIETGDTQVAESWIQVLMPLAAQIQQTSASADVLGAASEIALQRGQLESAKDFLGRCIHQWKNIVHPRCEEYILSTQLAIALDESDEFAIEAIMPRLKMLYDLSRARLGQDHVTARLVRALRSLGRVQQASDVLQDYLSRWRRSRAPISNELARLLAQG